MSDSFTLGDLKRRGKEEEEEEEGDEESKRYKTLNYTSEDPRSLNEPVLYTYYCFVCGSHALVLDTQISALPGFEDTNIIDTETTFYRSYLKTSDTMFIKRLEGIETRLMLRCNECDYPVGYRVKDKTELTRFLHILCDGVVTKQSNAESFFDPTSIVTDLKTNDSGL